MGNNETQEQLADEAMRDETVSARQQHDRMRLAREILAMTERVCDRMPWTRARDIADGVIGLGWRPPAHVIESIAELEALPVCAVVRWGRWGQRVEQCIGSGWFMSAGSENPVSAEALFQAAEGVSEITVLYVPDETGQAEQNTNPTAAEVNLVAAVAELAEVADDIRFMHRGELADRLDAIIAHHFGYIAIRIGEESANA